jgi:hypothetical protein
MDLNPYVFCDDMSRCNLCFNLYLLELIFKILSYIFGAFKRLVEQKTQVRSGHINRKDIRIQIHG